MSWEGDRFVFAQTVTAILLVPDYPRSSPKSSLAARTHLSVLTWRQRKIAFSSEAFGYGRGTVGSHLGERSTIVDP
jgi:hypothetical protein